VRLQTYKNLGVAIYSSVLFVMTGVVLCASLSGCAVNYGVSDADLELTNQERRAKYDREQREEGRVRREQRESKDWATWIADQEPGPGPAVLERGDLVLKAAIARAQYGGSGATRLTHLRMTAAARDLIVAGNTERALDLLERAIGVDGSEGFAYLYLGYVYVRRGDVERASGFLGQARRLLPPDPELRAEVRWLDSLAAVGPPEDGR
jgi:Flp pilus assembly protein TadD